MHRDDDVNEYNLSGRLHDVGGMACDLTVCSLGIASSLSGRLLLPTLLVVVDCIARPPSWIFEKSDSMTDGTICRKQRIRTKFGVRSING